MRYRSVVEKLIGTQKSWVQSPTARQVFLKVSYIVSVTSNCGRNHAGTSEEYSITARGHWFPLPSALPWWVKAALPSGWKPHHALQCMGNKHSTTSPPWASASSIKLIVLSHLAHLIPPTYLLVADSYLISNNLGWGHKYQAIKLLHILEKKNPNPVVNSFFTHSLTARQRANEHKQNDRFISTRLGPNPPACAVPHQRGYQRTRGVTAVTPSRSRDQGNPEEIK